MKSFQVAIIMVLTILLFGCTASSLPISEQPSQNLSDQHHSVSQPSTPVSSQAFQTDVSSIRDRLVVIHNDGLQDHERLDALEQLKKELEIFCENNTSTTLTDAEVSEILDEYARVTSISMPSNEHTYHLRMIQYQGPTDLLGTLENKFTLLQWWDESQFINAQWIIDGEAEQVTNYMIRSEDDSIELMLGGYVSLYSPKPVFVSLWELKGNQWMEGELQTDQAIGNSELWQISQDENMLLIESQQQEELEIDHNEGTNVFFITREDGSQLQLQWNKQGLGISVN